MAFANGILQAEGAGDRKALALKVFSGEVLTAFETNVVMADKHTVRTISSGKSAQFPVIGSFSDDNVADYSAGDTITPMNILHNERTISITALKVAPVFVDNYEEAISHYDVRGPYATEIGRALAKKYDKAVLATLETAASTAGVAGQASGSTVTEPSMTGGTAAENGNGIIQAIYEARTKLNQNDVPGDMYCVVSPENYDYLVQSTNGVNGDYTSGNGGLDSGNIMRIGGIPIFWSNNIPDTANLEGFVFTDNAVGTVKLLDVKTEVRTPADRLGDYLIGSYACGHDVLNPGCAVQLKSA